MSGILETSVRLEGYTLTNSKDGYTGGYKALISNLSGDVHQRLYDAENHPDLPVLFSAHPVVPGMYLKSRKAVFEKGDNLTADVTLQYGQLEEGEDEDENAATFATLEIIGGTITKESSLDKDGNDIIVSIDVERPELGGGLPVIDTFEQYGVYQREVPQVIIKATRREKVSAAAIAREYNGTINSAPIGGWAAGTFLASVTARAVKSGEEYDMAYEFRYEQDGWDPTVFYRDPATNAPAENLVEGKGIKTPEVYERKDFNQLNLWRTL